MSTSRLDTSIPDYFLGQAVTTGQVISGPIFPLYGAVGFHATGMTTGGAAGNLILYTSSIDPQLSPLNSAYPAQAGAISATIAANGVNILSLATNNAQIYARFGWLSFSPSASGTLYVGVNIRRYNA